VDGALSPDGKFVAFLSDRDGPFDAWVSQVGSGTFLNLTKGKINELQSDDHRNLSFSGDGQQVWLRVTKRKPGSSVLDKSVWVVPTMGGEPQPFLGDGTAHAEWSQDGTRIVYHGSDAGDPIFVTDPGQRTAHRIYAASPGVHCHQPTWSPDGRYIYFCQGRPPDQMDIWRIPPAGANAAERITQQNTRVGHPVMLDNRTLLYTALAEDASGPWLYLMDLKRRRAQRVSFGVEQYNSIAASADRRRLVATVSNPRADLWRVPISPGVVGESEAVQVRLPMTRAIEPRFGPNFLMFLSSKRGAVGRTDGLWKYNEGTATQLWQDEGAVTAAAISPDGGRVCLAVRNGGRTRLFTMKTDGTSVRRLAERLDVHGAPSWSPDSKWVAVASDEGHGPRLYRVPSEGGSAVRLLDSVSSHPVWSPDGRFIIYCGADSGGVFRVGAVTPNGERYRLPDLTLRRGAERFCFLPHQGALVFLKGDFTQRDFWLLDLKSGRERQLTNLNPAYIIREFDLSSDGSEILFDRFQQNSDLVLIELASR